ncbi:diguanylate cyclase (GGDEF) domain-containing protein [Sulfurivirga caldicuralii]|uniref:diguanylate cyclase n=1 Tax=Sulfurivirga caldicuralii TaxID=364032 RepID=A0A1N6GVW6_9GAMM|nr:GGDEF domain-containing protein [Sulfurivirga caldicuralii]SIO11679.1 diguanylate cyclase (GGDEF) domain-containing protein [Sulfurivirga caldicuralii]
MIRLIRRHFARLLYGKQDALSDTLLNPDLVRLILLTNAALMGFFLVTGLAGLFPLGSLHAVVLGALIFIHLGSAAATWLSPERSGTILLFNLLIYCAGLVPIILSVPTLFPALFTALIPVMLAFLIINSSAGLLTTAVAATLPFLLEAGNQEMLSYVQILIYEMTLGASALVTGTLGMLLRSLLQRLHATLEKLSHSATHDPLTGALNRRGLKEHGEVLFNTHYRTVSPLALAVIDLDYFKHVNDTFGHDAGDHVLKYLTDLIHRFFKRKSDLVARLGGDEFVLIAANTPLDLAHQRLTEMARHLQENPPRWNGEPLPVALSIGVEALDINSHHALKDLLKAADKLVYRAKEKGRSHVCAPHACTPILLSFEPPTAAR